jgi:telomerase reverse transcriptase
MKRKRKTRRGSGVEKRQKLDTPASDPAAWPLLRQYYPEVITLRQYLASKQTKLSKRRRRAILHYGEDDKDGQVLDEQVLSLLDHTAVGAFKDVRMTSAEDIDKDITIFTQQVSTASTITPTQGALKQSEVGTKLTWLFSA